MNGGRERDGRLVCQEQNLEVNTRCEDVIVVYLPRVFYKHFIYSLLDGRSH